jgi:hypothetical protein
MMLMASLIRENEFWLGRTGWYRPVANFRALRVTSRIQDRLEHPKPRLPPPLRLVAPVTAFAEAGGLLNYGGSLMERYRIKGRMSPAYFAVLHNDPHDVVG